MSFVSERYTPPAYPRAESVVRYRRNLRNLLFFLGGGVGGAILAVPSPVGGIVLGLATSDETPTSAGVGGVFGILLGGIVVADEEVVLGDEVLKVGAGGVVEAVVLWDPGKTAGLESF